MAGVIASAFLTGATVAFSGLKLVASVLFGTPSYDDEEDDTITTSGGSGGNAGSIGTKEGNGWDRHPVVQDNIRYKQGSRYRYSTSRENSLYLALIMLVSALIILSVLYIMVKEFRNKFNEGIISLFQTAGNKANVEQLKKTATLSRLAISESPLLKIFKNKYVTIGLVIIVLVLLVIIGMVVTRGVKGVLLIKDCSAKTQRVDVNANKIKPSKDGVAWSYNMWMYINDWEYNINKEKLFFEKKNSLKMSLDKNNPNVIVEVFTDSSNTDKMNISNICDENDLCTDGLDIEKWNMITITFDNNVFKFYHNGKLVLGRKLTGLPVFSDGSELTVGKINKDSSFHGSVSDVRYFKKTLSDSEIRGLYRNKP